MAEVLRQAPTNGFTELEVTQGADVPDEGRRLVAHPGVVDQQGPDDSDQLTKELKQRVDSTAFLELGDGSQSVYAYGYHCAPGRLKVGRTDGEVIDRIVRQINESTPERPVLSLVIRTENARALERGLQAVLELRDRKVVGGGDEWYVTTRDELVELYQTIVKRPA